MSDTSDLEQLKRARDAGYIDQAAYERLAALAVPGGAVAQGDGARAVGQQGALIDGDNSGMVNTGRHLAAAQGARIIYAEAGAKIVFGDAPVAMSAIDRDSLQGRYLQHIISHNRYLQLQGIRSGGRLVSIELDRIYVTLKTRRHAMHASETEWLAQESALAPGERHRRPEELQYEQSFVTVDEALAKQKRLIVLGDPGSGKTTLLRYLALLYARDIAERSSLVQDKLGLPESGALPIFVPLRQIGRYLAEHHASEDGTEGHAILLRFLAEALMNDRIEVPADFFDPWLHHGHAAVLLDGLDEVADPSLRRRVSRLVDAFTRAYPNCRYVITSRIVGYTDAARLSEGYGTTTVRDFSLEDIATFLAQWHRVVAIGQMGPGESTELHAAEQTRQLLEAIENNDRVRELAINPLMLTVIALIHRDRVKLPDRRAELYQEAVDVLLGKWDEARGVQAPVIVVDRPFDIADRRLVLAALALRMHESKRKEIDLAPLREILSDELAHTVSDPRERSAAVERFLSIIQERTGLLIARGEGAFAFSHLTFQEYLAAVAIAGRDDYVDYTLHRTADDWWREVILLESGHLSTQSKDKTTRLIRAISELSEEPVPHHNLVLAAECVRDVGVSRLVGDLEVDLRQRLQRDLEAPPASRGLIASVSKLIWQSEREEIEIRLRSQFRKIASVALPISLRLQATPAIRGLIALLSKLVWRTGLIETAQRQRITAAEALAKIGGAQYWSYPYGEPDWVRIRAGYFFMGKGREADNVRLGEYAIAKVPVTNKQYYLFVQATERECPPHWNGKRPPSGRESHPVVTVSWHDAIAYCRWLSARTNKSISLPSEQEWEKAARGNQDARAYPWGDAYNSAKCNADDQFGDTTPVGVFPEGASPYGCLDMAGNVWEWTSSCFDASYLSKNEPTDEDLNASVKIERIVRGGAFFNARGHARCASHLVVPPDSRGYGIGFRVVLHASPVAALDSEPSAL